MLPLKFAWVWLGLGIALLFVILGLALSPGGGVSMFWLFSDKAAHFLAFVVLMVWFCGVFRPRRTPWVAVGLVLFGLLIEFLQSLLPYRLAEWADAAYDVGGIALGWMLAFMGLRHWATWVERWIVRII